MEQKLVNIKETTPVEFVNGVYFKRDDKFEVAGVHGGKARSAYQLIQQGIEKGYNVFVTAGSRMSPQCELVSYLCQELGYKCHLFVPKGPSTSVLEHIEANDLSEVHYTFPRYNNVICSRAKKFAEENGYCYIPFGMECEANVEITKHQVQNIPEDCEIVVVPVGSGMSFISVANGLEYYNKHNITLIGVRVGKDPQKNFEKYLNAPNIKYAIINSDTTYETPARTTYLHGIELDPIYEAKCIDTVNEMSKKHKTLLWIVGKRL